MASINAGNSLDTAEDPAFSFVQMTETELEGLQLPPDAGLSGGLPQTNTVSSEALVSLHGVWFLAPESWTAEFTEPPPTTTQETERSLKQYIKKVQSWMRQWATEGHSPLYHRDLYSFHMPRHTQDAYTAMTMYYGANKTPETEATVHRILNDRVSQLLRDQAVEEVSSSLGSGSGSGNGMTIFEHLSRVQALLCYQVVRLFDGDIRMRAQAEALIPTLFMWNKQMLETAKESLGRPERFLVSSPFDPANLLLNNNNNMTENPSSSSSSSSSSKAVWRAWILAESVRRTWQATNVVQEVYLFLKRGWSECPGRLPSTMRKSLWEAPSAYLWTRELREGKDPLLVSMVGLEAIFAQTIPAEVDDFNRAVLGLYGMEKADQWLEEKGNRPQLLPAWESLFNINSMS
jgi:hypothetical protein